MFAPRLAIAASCPWHRHRPDQRWQRPERQSSQTGKSSAPQHKRALRDPLPPFCGFCLKGAPYSALGPKTKNMGRCWVQGRPAGLRCARTPTKRQISNCCQPPTNPRRLTINCRQLSANCRQ